MGSCALHAASPVEERWARTDRRGTALLQEGLCKAASLPFYSFAPSEPSVCTTATFPHPSKRFCNAFFLLFFFFPS